MFKKMRRVTPEVPGPPLMEALELRNDAIDFPRRMIEKHGDFVRLSPAQMDGGVFLLGKPEWIARLLVANRDNYVKDVILRSLQVIFGDSILVSSGETWRRNRRLMAPAFHRRSIESYAETMVECADATLSRLTLDEPISLQKMMMETTLDIALRCFFSTELGDRARTIERGVDDMMAYADLVTKLFSPVPLWLPLRKVRNVKRAVIDVEAVIDEIIAERRADSKEHDDVLSLLLDARDADGSQLSDDELRQEAITLVLAGHETVALALTYTINLLCRFPYALEPVLAELDEVLGDRPPTLEDAPKLVELDKLIKESMRLYPPAAIIGRTALEDDQIGEFTIPAGSVVNIPIFAIHHDERFYERPWEFDPQRWTPEMERELPRFAYLPFGGGNRICIGDAFAKLEARLVLARYLQLFEFELLDKSEPDLELSITMRPANEMLARVRLRER